mgnify:CR=1 FL=1
MKKINQDMINAICGAPYDLFSDLSEAEKTESRMCADIASAFISKRQSSSLSQAQLAERLGVQQPMISQLESGDYNYTISKISQMAAALELDVKIVFSDKSSVPKTDNLKVIPFSTRASRYPIRRSSKNTSFTYTEIKEG